MDAPHVLHPPAAFHAACQTIGLSLSEQEVTRLGLYLHELLETNRKFNLTAIREPDEAWMRHILDSLSLLGHLDDATSLIDVGTGGGLPGIPLAIAQDRCAVALLEATGKKARFCQGVIEKLHLHHARVVNERAETVGQDKGHRGAYDIAVARAVGPMRVLVELTLPLVTVGGRVLAMKGRRVEEELAEAGDALHLLGAGAIELYEALPGIEDDAVIVEITKERPTPRTYPRRPGEPKSRPL
jgi:16S rRNA (guanine527-N7)-methyltransferase